MPYRFVFKPDFFLQTYYSSEFQMFLRLKIRYIKFLPEKSLARFCRPLVSKCTISIFFISAFGTFFSRIQNKELYEKKKKGPVSSTIRPLSNLSSSKHVLHPKTASLHFRERPSSKLCNVQIYLLLLTK